MRRTRERSVIKKMYYCLSAIFVGLFMFVYAGAEVSAVEYTTTDAVAILETAGQAGIYTQPDATQNPIVIIEPGVYIKATGITSNGWFRVDVGGEYYMQGIALKQPGDITAAVTGQQGAATQSGAPVTTPEPVMPQRMPLVSYTINSSSEIGNAINQAAAVHATYVTITGIRGMYNYANNAASDFLYSPIHNYDQTLIRGISMSSSSTTCNIEFIRMSTIEEEMYVDQAVAQVLPQLNTGTTYDKVLAVHDYIINLTEYCFNTRDNIPGYDNRSAYDAFVNGKTVCTGYALLFQKFMDQMGIPCYIAKGNNHAWNIVCVDGAWYHIDCTNDDTRYGISRRLFLLGASKAGYSSWGGIALAPNNYPRR